MRRRCTAAGRGRRDSAGRSEAVDTMSLIGMPLLILNLGGEMIYILDQVGLLFSLSVAHQIVFLIREE